MRRLLTLSVVVCLFSQGLMAQDKTAMKYGNTITPQDMKAKLSVLASDEFMGRETGTEGQKLASKFLEDFYKKIGLTGPVNGTYRQKFSMYQSDWSDVYLKVKGKKKMNGKDFIFSGNANMDKEIKLPTVYIGDGSAISGMDIKDKGVIVTGSSREVQRSLIEAGVKAIFVASANDEQFMQTLPRQAAFRMKGRLRWDKENTGNESIVFNITKEMAADLLGTTTAKLDAAATSPSSIKEKSVSFQVKEKLAEISTENMAAFLEGTDLKDDW